MQYLENTGLAVPTDTESCLMDTSHDQAQFTREQRLLMEVRDKLCGGNASSLAREIGRDPTYANRLFYPAGKAGRKGIGLRIMNAASRAFFLPSGFWSSNPPVLDDRLVQRIREMRELRNAVMHGKATPEQKDIWSKLEPVSRAVYDLAHGPADDDFELPAFSRKGPEERMPLRLEPIHAWEYEEDLPPGEYAMVPRLNVKLSAGPGSGANQLSFDFDDGQLRAYSADWIRKNRLKPNKLRVMKGAGRSMEPTIFDGDDLLINLAETEAQDGKVYALWYEGGERVKRLYRMPGGGLRIRSDNEREFPEIVLGPEYMGHVRIIGRVIDRSGAGGL